MRLEDLKVEPEAEVVHEVELVSEMPPELVDPYFDSRRSHQSIIENFKNAHRFFFEVNPDGSTRKVPIGRARVPNVWGD